MISKGDNFFAGTIREDDTFGRKKTVGDQGLFKIKCFYLGTLVLRSVSERWLVQCVLVV